jgi:hypothetical protein
MTIVGDRTTLESAPDGQFFVFYGVRFQRLCIRTWEFLGLLQSFLRSHGPGGRCTFAVDLLFTQAVAIHQFAMSQRRNVP